MSTIQEKIQLISQEKDQLRTSITNKGVPVGNVFTTYSEAVDQIQNGAPIDDSAITTDKVWSSFKTNSEIQKETSGYTYNAEKNSMAIGKETEASGNYSFAEGSHTIASSSFQHVEGRYNVEDSNSQYLHIVGNGSGDNRHNAFAIKNTSSGTKEGVLVLFLANGTPVELTATKLQQLINN